MDIKPKWTSARMCVCSGWLTESVPSLAYNLHFHKHWGEERAGIPTVLLLDFTGFCELVVGRGEGVGWGAEEEKGRTGRSLVKKNGNSFRFSFVSLKRKMMG